MHATLPGHFSARLAPSLPFGRAFSVRSSARHHQPGGICRHALEKHEGSGPDPAQSHRRDHQSFMAPPHKERPHAFFIITFHSSFMVIA